MKNRAGCGIGELTWNQMSLGMIFTHV